MRPQASFKPADFQVGLTPGSDGTPAQALETAWRSVCDDLTHGRYAEALDTCSAVLATLPDEGRFWMLRGLALHGQANPGEACSALETASVLAPLSSEAQYALADCYARLGRSLPALAICEHLISRDELPVHLLPLVARLSASLGDFEGALQACRRAGERDPWADGAFFGAAHYMSRLKYPPRLVLAVLGKAFALRPDHTPYRLAMARLLDTLGRPGEAFAMLQVLPVDAFTELTCRACVERLINLFLRFKDDDRAAACALALRSIERDGCREC